MKSQRNLVLVIFMMVMFMAATLPAFGSAEEYKVIKNAVKSKDSSGDDVAWFRLEVNDKTEKKATVKIKIPISLVEMIADNEAEDINIKGKCKVNLKKILQALKKNGPTTLVEVDDEDALVKIWIE